MKLPEELQARYCATLLRDGSLQGLTEALVLDCIAVSERLRLASLVKQTDLHRAKAAVLEELAFELRARYGLEPTK